jgi:hypothetical protein
MLAICASIGGAGALLSFLFNIAFWNNTRHAGTAVGNSRSHGDDPERRRPPILTYCCTAAVGRGG